MKKYFIKSLLALSICAGFYSCEVQEYSDLNNPEVDAFAENLTRGDLQDLVGGILYSSRVGLGTYYDDCGVIGREYYRFSSSDPRFTSDLLGGENSVLDNNTFYITTPWSARYRTVKNANLILGFLEAQDLSAIFTNEELSATRGFLNTMIAHELLLNLNLTDEGGIRIDVADETNLGPIVSKSEALSFIKSTLDAAALDLSAGGDAFPFVLSSGFGDFNTPASFSQVSNALAARVAAYQGDFAGVLSSLEDSFLTLDNNELDLGVYHNFTQDQTDILNPMFFALNSSTAGARIAQPSFITDAETDDQRLDKVVLRESALTLDGLTGEYDVFRYTSNVDPIPIIRKEELLLLYAEANITINPMEAVTALDIIRESAGLDPYTGAMDAASLTDEMLTQRRYSLYAEGHRWIDVRRYNRLDELPIDRANDDVFSQFPIPLTEL
ncbi:RagB/SusD family nutrient uptake outer membrane protein [Dokdonia donghaensis]|uniref:Membrane protein n=1 Tax=Dokdonia donghaensis DSW-1 TaxID=1300343 RepID=A0A0A2H1T6_9FLAO|nr:RagB/SusD family nutrient uptake outer membrane protein [Dokdonia donghaensis]ANH59207.1 SusD family protein [Dokdonia donghaensis DSW-1]KGO06620.1 membrane protein [Dokdonia donghaensis DSW-1]